MIDPQKLEGPWFTQAGSMVPLFVTSTTLDACASTWGPSYGRILFTFAAGQGQIHYLMADLERVWSGIDAELERSPGFFVAYAVRYARVMAEHRAAADVERSALAGATDTALLAMLRRAVAALADALGGHVIEAAGFGLERALRANLAAEGYEGMEHERTVARIAVPPGASFAAVEEQHLRRIAALAGNAREEAIDAHLRDFEWILHSYAGPRALTREVVVARLEELPSASADADAFPLPEVDLVTTRIAALLRDVGFLQDERKQQVLMGIGALGRVVDQVAARAKIDAAHLHFLTAHEAMRVANLDVLTAVPLQERRAGMLVLQEADAEGIETGAAFLRHAPRAGATPHGALGNVLFGAIACTGVAVGRVVICTELRDIEQVREGDILVTSMTRPEYLAAMRRAAAFVTDEGGITCHAAIVAREMHKPCIIGTKIGTRMLRTGMVAEVRANHGFVRILADAPIRAIVGA